MFRWENRAPMVMACRYLILLWHQIQIESHVDSCRGRQFGWFCDIISRQRVSLFEGTMGTCCLVVLKGNESQQHHFGGPLTKRRTQMCSMFPKEAHGKMVVFSGDLILTRTQELDIGVLCCTDSVGPGNRPDPETAKIDALGEPPAARLTGS